MKEGEGFMENDTWKKAQEFEIDWHLNQQFNTYNEQTKQYTYASLMGLDYYKTDYYGQIGWDLGDISVLDIGSGEQSILLKTKAGKRTVLDPLMDKFPTWVGERYKEAGIETICSPAEDFTKGSYDCVLIYNVLEHVIDPKKIIDNALELGKVVRIFEWVGNTTNIGHIHSLKQAELDEWLGGEGKVEVIKRGGANGKAYYGIFKGRNYE